MLGQETVIARGKHYNPREYALPDDAATSFTLYDSLTREGYSFDLSHRGLETHFAMSRQDTPDVALGVLPTIEALRQFSADPEAGNVESVVAWLALLSLDLSESPNKPQLRLA